ncbi:MAG: hypothetical protein AAB886_02590 [Patescibacteria group bacterium]
MNPKRPQLSVIPTDATYVWTSRISDLERNALSLQFRSAHREPEAGPLSVFRTYFAADSPSAATMRLEHAAISVALPIPLECLVRDNLGTESGRKLLGDTTVLMDGLLRLAENNRDIRIALTGTQNWMSWSEWRQLRDNILMPKLREWLSRAMGSVLAKSQNSALSPIDREIARAFDSARTYASGTMSVEVSLFEIALNAMVGFVKSLHGMNFFPH